MLLQISTTEHMLKCVGTSRSALHLVSQLKMDCQKKEKAYSGAKSQTAFTANPGTQTLSRPHSTGSLFHAGTSI